ncbi:MAG: hypothetical protein J6U13_00430 [Salinivirgaceae bacterium]|nr:hypothetical protein [Salinivirgaceae bacterium]
MEGPFTLKIEDTFFIKEKGLVVTGILRNGSVDVGDYVTFSDGSTAVIDAIIIGQSQVNTAKDGDNVGLLFRNLTKKDVKIGTVLTK